MDIAARQFGHAARRGEPHAHFRIDPTFVLRQMSTLPCDDRPGALDRTLRVGQCFRRGLLQPCDHRRLAVGGTGAGVGGIGLGISGARRRPVGLLSIDPRERAIEPRGDQRGVAEAAVDLRLGTAGGVDQRLAGAAAFRRITASQQIVGEEAVDRGGDRRLTSCFVALVRGLPGGGRGADDAERQRDAGGDHPRPASTRPLRLAPNSVLLERLGGGTLGFGVPGIEHGEIVGQQFGRGEAIRRVKGRGASDILA